MWPSSAYMAKLMSVIMASNGTKPKKKKEKKKVLPSANQAKKTLAATEVANLWLRVIPQSLKAPNSTDFDNAWVDFSSIIISEFVDGAA